MNTEVRFLLAIVLMIAVLVVTNVLFPPVTPEGPVEGEPAAGEVVDTAPAGPEAIGDLGPGALEPDTPAATRPEPGRVAAEPEPGTDDAAAGAPAREVVVESPLYEYTFSTRGGRLTSARLPGFRSFIHEGAVELVPPGSPGSLGTRIVVGRDTLDLRDAVFESDAGDRVTLIEGGPPETLTFRWSHPTAAVGYEIAYTFEPDHYLVRASGRVTGLDRPLVVTDLGAGVAYNEADSAAEVAAMSWVANHLQEGVEATSMSDAEERRVVDGPFLWAALKSKFFVVAMLPGREEGGDDYLGGILVSPGAVEGEAAMVSATHPVGSDGAFDHRFFMGPQEYARLTALGADLEEVNPYGWRFFRPIVRPFVSVIMTVLTFLHNTLSLAYGWVLILFGVLMRVLLWPLNHKAMRAQMRNMAVQPLVKEIQTKYKDNPEKMQKEMMRLYKEYGFNPLAGCLPMLLPWPVLIALFFVFQNTIELRGVDFLWIPDLSAPDPLYLLPAFLGISMFFLQFISLRSMDQDNPQMKMMMWIMPIFMVFIFFRLPAGLNLYYATANIATLPQQVIIARERKKAQARGPVKLQES